MYHFSLAHLGWHFPFLLKEGLGHILNTTKQTMYTHTFYTHTPKVSTRDPAWDDASQLPMLGRKARLLLEDNVGNDLNEGFLRQ